MGMMTIGVMLLAQLQAPQLPDADTLLRRVDEAYRSFTTLKYEMDTMIEQPGKGNPRRPATRTREWCVIGKAGKRHTETFTASGLFINISDGKTTWIYDSARKEYTKSDKDGNRPGVPSADAPDKPRPHMNHRTLREEVIEIDGRTYECWVVETRPYDTLSSSSATSDSGSRATVELLTQWIDKKLLLERQSIQLTKIERAESVTEFLATSVTKNFSINEPVADSTFTFVPPLDAREVKALGLRPLPTVDMVGKDAPEFRVKGVDATVYSLASLKGKPVLLDFWATWCEPCRESMPVLEKVYAEYKDQGLVILGVNSNEDLKTVKAFLRKTPFAFPVVLSGDSGIRDAYHVRGIPTFVLIGRDGRIAAQQVGFSNESEIRSTLEKAGLKAAPKSQ